MRCESSAGNTRGLIEAGGPATCPLASEPSSAGNTRGLIEAGAGWRAVDGGAVGLPRGIPAASLKRIATGRNLGEVASLPRGIPAASLKRAEAKRSLAAGDVFRGEYPRPH